MNRCDRCIHKDVCSRELKDPCGLYSGFCESCYHWEKEKIGTAGRCIFHDTVTYQHYYCGAHTDPEWVKKFYEKETNNDSGRET